MKVLVVSSSVYTNSIPNSSITGLAVMVRDIYDEVSKYCEVYLWPSQTILPAEDPSESFHILNGGVKRWSRGIHYTDILKAFIHSSFRVGRFKSILRKNAILRIQVDIFKNLLHEVNPDIVNFHDFDDLNTQLMLYCHHKGIKSVVTNHLYIGHAAGCSNYDYSRRNENILLSQHQLNVSVISTGMKSRMMQDYPQLKDGNIYITKDGTSFKASGTKKAAQGDSRKILLFVANVMERKNQLQLVRALSLFDKLERSKFVVYFLGSDSQGQLVKAIRHYHCEDVAEYKGKVRSEEMADFYANAFATITTTWCEGFGLTMIEGYAYGIPAILPDDIDSFEDIYEKNTAVAIHGRNDHDIVSAIKQCLSTEWDSDAIRHKSCLFTMDKVALEYIKMYKEIINKL